MAGRRGLPVTGRVRGMSRRVRCFVAVVTCVAVVGSALVIATAGLLFLGIPQAGAASCDTTWNGANADWSTAGDWSGGLPTSSTNACLPAGSYTVTDMGSDSAQVASLTIGIGPTLVISNDSDNNSGTLSASSGISNAGTIELTTGNSCGGCTDGLFINGGTLTNTGTLEAELGDSANTPVTIAGNIDNQATFSVDRSVQLNKTGATYTNTSTGTITIASGQTMAVTGGDNTHSFNLNGGTLTNNGTFTQAGGSFNHNAGTASGNDLIVDSVAIAPDPSSGSRTSLSRRAARLPPMSPRTTRCPSPTTTTTTAGLCRSARVSRTRARLR